jgi:hypothetical protein
VHELVGGVVDHEPSHEQESSETALMLQKLYSMNLMAYEGWDPNMELWEVRRVMCASIHQVCKHTASLWEHCINASWLVLLLLVGVCSSSSSSRCCGARQAALQQFG